MEKSKAGTIKKKEVPKAYLQLGPTFHWGGYILKQLVYELPN